jgi:DNA-binding transcriptional MerR regulator
MAKSADAFRTISEVSTELDVPKHVLRFWEQRFKQLKPLKRGGGRRFYRPEDVELLKGIQTLLNRDAYTIRGVQRILREHGIERVKRLASSTATGGLIPALQAGDTAVPATAGPSNGHAKAGRKKAARDPSRATASARTPLGRDVLAAAIEELSACRALLVGTAALKTKGEAPATSAGSRR